MAFQVCDGALILTLWSLTESLNEENHHLVSFCLSFEMCSNLEEI